MEQIFKNDKVQCKYEKTEIKENITVDKAQQLYNKYKKAMKILEDK